MEEIFEENILYVSMNGILFTNVFTNTEDQFVVCIDGCYSSIKYPTHELSIIFTGTTYQI